jgi:L-aspartate oxidase
MRAIDPARFPNVVSSLREAGLDPARERIPVSPAAHYMMGGVVTDVDAHSTLAGLYAVGETSDSGLHGANRLASNSLSECFVFARRAVADILAEALGEPRRAREPSESELGALEAERAPEPADAQTRAALWRDGGIVRTEDGLERLLADAHPLARMIARSALAREESRGAHARVDHPAQSAAYDGRHAVVRAGRGEGDGELEWQAWE